MSVRREDIIDQASKGDGETWKQAAYRFGLPFTSRNALRHVAKTAVRLGDIAVKPEHW